MKDLIKRTIGFVKNYELEANLTCLITGVVIGRFPRYFLLALWMLIVVGGVFLTVVMIYAASDSHLETTDEKCLREITKKGK